MGKKVFISGPIQGVETDQSYRERISQICVSRGFEPIDPWLREKALYRGAETKWWSRVPAQNFIERDLRDIERSDLLVAFFPTLSAGTCMELFYSRLRGKKTISICKIADPSPWIVYHSSVMIHEIEELGNVLAKI